MGNCNCNCSCISKSDDLDGIEVSGERRMIDPKSVYQNIVRIQSSFRGYLARKTFYDERLTRYNKQVIENLQKFAATQFKIRSYKMQPYKYDLKIDDEDPLFENRIFKPLVTLPGDQGVYVGEWFGYFHQK